MTACRAMRHSRGERIGGIWQGSWRPPAAWRVHLASLRDVYNSGERSVVPDQEGWDRTFQGMIYLQHLFAYETVKRRCLNKRVLEVGCGAGYGARLLSQVASSVTAIDTSRLAIDHAKEHYAEANLEFWCVPLEELAARQPASFDVVVSFQTIEHVRPERLTSFLKAAASSLKTPAAAFFTTPNRCRRLHFMDKPRNPYHYQEWTPWSFRRLCSRFFPSVRIRGVVGSELVMRAEWERGTRVGPLAYFLRSRYFLGSPPGRRMVRLLRAAERGFRDRALCRPHVPAVVETPGAGAGDPEVWEPPRPYSLADFGVQETPGWWCLDLYAECRNTRGSALD